MDSPQSQSLRYLAQGQPPSDPCFRAFFQIGREGEIIFSALHVTPGAKWKYKVLSEATDQEHGEMTLIAESESNKPFEDAQLLHPVPGYYHPKVADLPNQRLIQYANLLDACDSTEELKDLKRLVLGSDATPRGQKGLFYQDSSWTKEQEQELDVLDLQLAIH